MKDRWNTKEIIGKSTRWVGRHFKPIWRESKSSYVRACEDAFVLCNRIRYDLGVPQYDRRKFDEGIQYQSIFQDDYEASRVAFVNVVFGWW